MSERESRANRDVRRSPVARGSARRRRAAGRTGRRRTPRRSPWAPLGLAALFCLVVAAIFLYYGEGSAETVGVTSVERPALKEAPEVAISPERARAVEKLDARLVEISRTHAGVHGAIVFDPISGEKASLNADRRFVAASLSKLYALLTLYTAASRGEVDLEDKITMRASDVWAEGTGVLYSRPVGTTMTLRECATVLIKESDNTAEVMLNRYLGEKEIEAELRRVGARSTSYWLPNTTTPDDVLLVLRAISDPSHTSPKLSEEMLDIMTGTSFEDRLPQPLPGGTRVAHKIGSWETTFSDAGIVFPEGDDEGYYVVVFSEGAAEATARGVIQHTSLAAHQALASSRAR